MTDMSFRWEASVEGKGAWDVTVNKRPKLSRSKYIILNLTNNINGKTNQIFITKTKYQGITNIDITFFCNANGQNVLDWMKQLPQHTGEITQNE